MYDKTQHQPQHGDDNNEKIRTTTATMSNLCVRVLGGSLERQVLLAQPALKAPEGRGARWVSPEPKEIRGTWAHLDHL